MLIYEVYVDKFARDFQGMTGKLGYLKKLGVDAVWLLPFYPSPMVDGGYDITDYCNVRPDLGTIKDFQNFVARAHEMGIKIIIDLVLNHVSTQHPWFAAKPDYFLWSTTGTEFPKAINPFAHMEPSNWVRDPMTGEYYFATFYQQQADLNWDNPDVLREMTKVIDFWAGYGVDGFRLDAVSFLVKREDTNCTNLPETHAIVKKIRAHVDAKHPDVFLLAEAHGTEPELATYFGNGDQCQMVLRCVLNPITKNLASLPAGCQWANFLRSHDNFLQEGDEEGIAKRLADMCDGDQEKILEAFRYLLGIPGVPVLYYGDELGTRNPQLPTRPRDTREYLRGDFDWAEAERQSADPSSLLNRVIEIMG